METVKVLLVEDHTMTRMGLELTLQKVDKIELIAQAEDGVKGVEFYKTFQPDVVLMDIGLPYLDGIEATRKIKALNPDAKVLIFTSKEAEQDVFGALAAGATGYIMKGTTPEQLVSAILAVNEGTAWLDPAIARMVLSSVQKQPQKTFDSDGTSLKNQFGLTKRELEVLELIVEGLTNPQIAEKLFITISTAKAHVHSILQKLYVDSKSKAAVLAMKEGLL